MAESSNHYFPECTGLSKNTIRLYTSYIDTWISHLPHTSQDIHFLLMFPKKSLSYLQSVLSDSTANQQYLSAVHALFQYSSHILHDIPHYHELESQWKSLQLSTDKIYSYIHQSITIQNIIAYRDSLVDGSVEKLLISMYTMIPPVSTDYFAVHILTCNDTLRGPDMVRFTNNTMTNCSLILANKQIYYRNLPDTLVQQIKQSYAISPRKYLFADAQNMPFSRSAFQSWATVLLSRCFTVHMPLSYFIDICCTDNIVYRWCV